MCVCAYVYVCEACVRMYKRDIAMFSPPDPLFTLIPFNSPLAFSCKRNVHVILVRKVAYVNKRKTSKCMAARCKYDRSNIDNTRIQCVHPKFSELISPTYYHRLSVIATAERYESVTISAKE